MQYIVQPHFDYCCEVLEPLGTIQLCDCLQNIHNIAARIITGCTNTHFQSELFKHVLKFVNCCIQGHVHYYFHNYFKEILYLSKLDKVINLRLPSIKLECSKKSGCIVSNRNL